jgi:hypothetical protein
VAAVSVFLSFVPFQILKRTGQHSREIIFIALKKAKFSSMPGLGPNGLFLVVNGLVSESFLFPFLRRFRLRFFVVNVHHSVGRG